MEILQKLYEIYPTRGRKCDGCNLGEDYYSDGYRTLLSGLFFHTKCANSSPEISNLYHPQHSLKLKVVAENEDVYGKCYLCSGNLPKMYYNCYICDFSIDIICANKGVIERLDGVKTHQHPLFLVPKMIKFTCHLCELSGDRFPYVCNLCDVSFHKDCAESESELNYACHPKHILKRLTRIPSYSNGKCCLCERKLQIVFYHCSICNFSVDVDCAKNPPRFTLLNPKAHDHLLTFMSQRSFICNACGMDDDPNPYVCLQCNFMIHRNCLDIPQVMKINRHHHHIYYKHFLDAGDWECGVCHKEINWTCGAYSCLECPHFAIQYVRCATRSDIKDVMELNITSEDTKSYEVIEEGVIKHISHKKHTLQLKEDNGIIDACMWCIACSYPIISSSYYICLRCDDFILHKKCAYLPRKKIDSIYKMRFTLNTEFSHFMIIFCDICKTYSKGFFYENDHDKNVFMDVRCGSISEPIAHESHSLHSLYINYSTKAKVCNACGDKANIVISCDQECEFFLDIRCFNLPKMVKHRSDEDHFLSLCYGGNSDGQYWCEICEEKVNPKKWFYSCLYCGTTFHIQCALGDFTWIKPGDQLNDLVCMIFNNGMARPVCSSCGLRCQFSTILKFGKFMLCSQRCLKRNYKTMIMEIYGRDTKLT